MQGITEAVVSKSDLEAMLDFTSGTNSKITWQIKRLE